MKRTLLLVAVLGTGLFAQQSAPDNTKANRRASETQTSDDQSNAKGDLQIAKQIRRDITKDSTLSTYAHNAKVIVRNGNVTLKGPVRSAEERTTLETIAANIAGDGKVTNELEIAKKEK